MPFLTPRARESRQAAGRKAVEFARAVEISRSHLLNAENGGQPVSVEVAYRIANQLSVDVSELIEYRRSA